MTENDAILEDDSWNTIGWLGRVPEETEIGFFTQWIEGKAMEFYPYIENKGHWLNTRIRTGHLQTRVSRNNENLPSEAQKRKNDLQHTTWGSDNLQQWSPFKPEKRRRKFQTNTQVIWEAASHSIPKKNPKTRSKEFLTINNHLTRTETSEKNFPTIQTPVNSLDNTVGYVDGNRWI